MVKKPSGRSGRVDPTVTISSAWAADGVYSIVARILAEIDNSSSRGDHPFWNEKCREYSQRFLQLLKPDFDNFGEWVRGNDWGDALFREFLELSADPGYGNLYGGRKVTIRDQIRVSCYNLCVSLYSKYDDGETSPEKIKAAVTKYLQCESNLNRVNLDFEEMTRGNNRFYTMTSDVLFRARELCQYVLGYTPDTDTILRSCAFGPGASTRLGRNKKNPAYKYSGTPETSHGNIGLAMAAIAAVPLWSRALCEEGSELPDLAIRNFNRIVTVPKNSKTDRIISIEPDMNIYVQKGIGAEIRDRLRRVTGIDLNRQELNQSLACEGSRTGRLATIDLSAASDSISRGLVEFLLPPAWYSLLEQARTPCGVFDSQVRKVVGDVPLLMDYAKFSSMGNGFTFELETLIFWSLTKATVEWVESRVYDEAPGRVLDNRVFVYGDDIIVDARVLEWLSDVFQEVGFTINEKKTWATLHEVESRSQFRESCGKHYLGGLDVTPFFHRKPFSVMSDVFLFHNNLRRWLWRTVGCADTDVAQQFLVNLRNRVPNEWRKPRIPDGYGDGAFIGYFDEATPSRDKRGREFWSCNVLAEHEVLSKESTEETKLGLVLSWLAAAGDRTKQSHSAIEAGLPVRLKKRVVKILVSRSWDRAVDPQLIEWELIPFGATKS